MPNRRLVHHNLKSPAITCGERVGTSFSPDFMFKLHSLSGKGPKITVNLKERAASLDSVISIPAARNATHPLTKKTQDFHGRPGKGRGVPKKSACCDKGHAFASIGPAGNRKPPISWHIFFPTKNGAEVSKMGQHGTVY